MTRENAYDAQSEKKKKDIKLFIQHNLNFVSEFVHRQKAPKHE